MTTVAFLATVYQHIDAFHLPFIKRLRDKGVEVIVYAGQTNGVTFIPETDVPVIQIPFTRSPFNITSHVNSYRKLVADMRKREVNLLHVHTPIAAFIGRMAAQRVRIPFVMYTAHGFHFYKGAPIKNWLIYYPMERLAAQWTDLLLTINHEDFSTAKKMAVRGEVEYVQGVGVDVESIVSSANDGDKIRDEFGIADNSLVITCVAELNENKNHQLLLRALAFLKDRGERNVRCLLVGDGGNRKNLEQLVDELSLEDTVVFCGFRRDVPGILAATDVCVLPSKREGLPLCILEAMAAGLPCIVTDVRGSRDLVKDGCNGYVVPLNDPNKLATAIKDMFSCDVRKAMGETGKKMVRDYTLNSIMDRMLNFYDFGLQMVH